jgi:hypothetical protein
VLKVVASQTMILDGILKLPLSLFWFNEHPSLEAILGPCVFRTPAKLKRAG